MTVSRDMARLTLLLLLTLATVAVLSAQNRPDGGGFGQVQAPRDTPAQSGDPRPEVQSAGLMGRVLDGRSGQPVQRARVVVVPREGEGRGVVVLTDQNGQYAVTGLSPGRYTVEMSKPGFVTIAYGQRRPRQPATPVELREGQSLRGIDVVLPPGGVVTGRIVDETGAPLPLTTVQVFRHVYRQGRRQLVPAGTDRTDDRGHYRIFGLESGRYYVSGIVPRQLSTSGRAGFPPAFRRFDPTSPPGGDISVDPLGYAPTYYPGVTNLTAASQVDVALGAEATGVDFAVRLVPTARVGGVVFGPEGAPATGARVILVPDSAIVARNALLGARLQANGSFEIPDVPPGQYTIRAVTRGPRAGRSRFGGPALFASHFFSVDGSDVSDITLVLRPGATVAGRVVLDTLAQVPPSTLARVRVTASATEDIPLVGDPETRIANDATFELANVPDGGRLLRASNVPSGWMLKAVYIDGQDVIDTPLDFGGVSRLDDVQLVLTDQVTRLTGSVRDPQDTPLTEFTVVAFPNDERRWQPQSRYVKAARPDQNANYQIEGLPAGHYLLAAVDDVQEGEWFDPRFLRQLSDAAVRVWLNEGDSTALDLTLRTQP